MIKENHIYKFFCKKMQIKFIGYSFSEKIYFDKKIHLVNHMCFFINNKGDIEIKRQTSRIINYIDTSDYFSIASFSENYKKELLITEEYIKKKAFHLSWLDRIQAAFLIKENNFPIEKAIIFPIKEAVELTFYE